MLKTLTNFIFSCFLIIVKSPKKTTETENYGSVYTVRNRICHILKYQLILM